VGAVGIGEGQLHCTGQGEGPRPGSRIDGGFGDAVDEGCSARRIATDIADVEEVLAGRRPGADRKVLPVSVGGAGQVEGCDQARVGCVQGVEPGRGARIGMRPQNPGVGPARHEARRLLEPGHGDHAPTGTRSERGATSGRVGAGALTTVARVAAKATIVAAAASGGRAIAQSFTR